MLPRLAICGVVRNAAAQLRSSLEAIDRICQSSEYAEVILVTNDNEDDTSIVLNEWSRFKKSVRIIDCAGAIDAFPNRVDRLAFARNIYLNEMRERNDTIDLMIVMDMDGLNANVEASAIEYAVLSAPKDWVGIFANQDRAYFDLYALRRDGWVSSDVWADYAKSTNWMGNIAFRLFSRLAMQWPRKLISQWYANKHVYAKQFCIPTSLPFLPVQSAFGGLGIYRYASISRAWYSSRDISGRTICEHVNFHSQLRKGGGRLYICPSLINATPLEHVGPNSGSEFPSNLIEGLPNR